MSNVLLVDTNFSSGPIYQFLIEFGHNVTVVGGNPDDALAKSVDDYVNLDYSDVAKIRQLITHRQIDYLVPGCNDLSYMVCAEINQDGHFPGLDPLETAEIIHNKGKFRAFSVQNHLPTPLVLSDQEIGTRWPVIVKPVDAYSGRGITIIHKEKSHELQKALELASHASRTQTYIVEDYVDGQLFSHTAFIQGGEIIADNIVEEYGTTNPFVVDTSRVTYNFSADILEEIRQNIRHLSSKLNLANGLVHTQFIKNGNQYWLIEVTRRCPGDLYSQLIELSTGLNYAENYVRPFVGLSLNIKGNDQKKWVMRHTITQPYDYTFGSLSFGLSLMIRKWVQISLTGDRLQASPSSRVGIIFIEDENEESLNKTFSSTLERRLYSVQP